MQALFSTSTGRGPRSRAVRPGGGSSRRLLALGFALMATPGAALELGSSDFVYVSDLLADGYEPFAANGGGAVLGMRKDAEMYLCFLLDTPAAQAARQSVLLSALEGTPENRTLPNIALACVLTQ